MVGTQRFFCTASFSYQTGSLLILFRLRASRRRRAIYVSSCSPRPCRGTQAIEDFLPSPSTSRPSTEAREEEEGKGVAVERDGQRRVPYVGVVVGRQNRSPRHKYLLSHLRLPAFPPGVNSLDHVSGILSGGHCNASLDLCSSVHKWIIRGQIKLHKLWRSYTS